MNLPASHTHLYFELGGHLSMNHCYIQNISCIQKNVLHLKNLHAVDKPLKKQQKNPSTDVQIIYKLPNKKGIFIITVYLSEIIHLE